MKWVTTWNVVDREGSAVRIPMRTGNNIYEMICVKHLCTHSLYARKALIKVGKVIRTHLNFSESQNMKHQQQRDFINKILSRL